MREIVIYNFDSVPERIKAFEEVLINKELRHLATELACFGIKNPEEIFEAIEKAIEVCRITGIPVTQNFKPVFVCKRNRIFRDWKLSDLALKLVLINAGIHNEIVCFTQADLVRKSLVLQKG